MKIFEKVIHKRIIAFIDKYNLQSKFQFRFRKSRGTKDDLSLVTKFIYEQLDKSTPTTAVILKLVKETL